MRAIYVLPELIILKGFLQYGLPLATTGWVRLNIKVALSTVWAPFTVDKLGNIKKLETPRLSRQAGWEAQTLQLCFVNPSPYSKRFSHQK